MSLRRGPRKASRVRPPPRSRSSHVLPRKKPALESARAPHSVADRSPFRIFPRIRFTLKRRARRKKGSPQRQARRQWSWRTRALLAIVILAGVYLIYPLPSVVLLRWVNPSSSAFMDHYREEERGSPELRQRFVPLNEIAPMLREAVLVAEDDAFYDHDGVDFAQLRKSVETNLSKGRYVRGGSTITMQLAKNLYLSPSKSVVRKVRELCITFMLEAFLPKERILEIYLNVIEWGPGIYGAEEASQHWFKKSAKRLSAAEAATLAAAITAPRKSNPSAPSARLAARRDLLLERMRRKGVLH